MDFTTLISTAELAAQLGDPRLAIVDCRFDLEDVEWGALQFAAGHVRGARYAHLDRDLSGEKTGTERPASPARSARVRRDDRALGISNDSQVVAYDQDTGSYASRLWWMLRWLGHDRVAVLDGGWAKWTAEGRPTSAGAVPAGFGRFAPHVRPELVATLDEVDELTRRGALLLDARAPERYSGQTETIDRAAGHIPGASNYFYMQNLGVSGTFLPDGELASNLAAATDGTPGDQIICYCGSGVTACHNLLALEHAGIHGAKLYPGSWSGWSADPSRPIATTER